MVEAEMIFTNLEDIIALAERLVKHVVDYVLTNNFLELKFLQKRNQKDLIAKLKELINKKFVKIEYSECIKILAKQKKNFVFNDVK